MNGCSGGCTGRDALTDAEVAATLTRVIGRPIVYRQPGALRFYRHMRARGLPRAYVAVMVALHTTARVGLAAHLSPELEQRLGGPPGGFRAVRARFRRRVAVTPVSSAPPTARRSGNPDLRASCMIGDGEAEIGVGADPHAPGGLLLPDLAIPAVRAHAVDVP